jgi:general secretion pathway protein K
MPTPGTSRKRDRKGSALLTVLWISAALSAIAFSVSTTVRSETERVSTAADGLRAWYLATGSVERAIQWMCWGDQYRTMNGTPRFYEWNKVPRMYMSFPSGDAIVELIPESAKFNINQASPDELLRVVSAVSGDLVRAQQIVGAILDWRAGGYPSIFDQYYATIDPTFRARHASFQEIEELLLVRGMTPELYYGNYVPDGQGRLYATGGLRDSLSVWGSSGPFDVNTASSALMQAVGVPAPGAAAIIARRQILPFKSMGEVGALGYPAPRLKIGGNVIWTLRGTARLKRPDGSPSEVVRTAGAVVKILDPEVFPMMPVHVLRWYDDDWSESAITPPGAPPVGVPQP